MPYVRPARQPIVVVSSWLSHHADSLCHRHMRPKGRQACLAECPANQCSCTWMYCKRFRTCSNRSKSFPALVVPGGLLVCSHAQYTSRDGACSEPSNICNTSVQQQEAPSGALTNMSALRQPCCPVTCTNLATTMDINGLLRTGLQSCWIEYPHES